METTQSTGYDPAKATRLEQTRADAAHSVALITAQGQPVPRYVLVQYVRAHNDYRRYLNDHVREAEFDLLPEPV